MNTTENNKLIAEFMGEQFTDSSGVVQGLNYKLIEKKHGEGNNGFRFHTCWNWLMPVVEKIQKLYEECVDYNNQMPGDYYYKVLDKGISTPREIIYQAVVEFIKWYNQNKED